MNNFIKDNLIDWRPLTVAQLRSALSQSKGWPSRLLEAFILGALVMVFWVFLFNFLFPSALLLTDGAMVGLESESSSAFFSMNFSAQMVGAFALLSFFYLKPFYFWLKTRPAWFNASLPFDGGAKAFISRALWIAVTAMIRLVLVFATMSLTTSYMTAQAMNVSAQILNNVAGGADSLSADMLAHFSQGTSIMVALVAVTFTLSLSVYRYSGLWGRWLFFKVLGLYEKKWGSVR